MNSCQASTMLSGGPRATDTQCPFDSSCRKKRHLGTLTKGHHATASAWLFKRCACSIRRHRATNETYRTALEATMQLASSLQACVRC